MHPFQRLAPRDPELIRIGGAVHAARPDLQRAFPSATSPEFCEWLYSNGPIEDERIARFFPPLPPAELRATACGGMDPRGHLYTGLQDYRIVAELFALFDDRDLGELEAVFDFGCGCGRLARWLAMALPDATIHGSDVRAAAIEWCRAELPGRFFVNATAPPLELPDDSVDLTVALSVFSHLDRDPGLAWLRELARVTRPGGMILASTHGAFALALTARSAQHQKVLKIDAADVPGLMRQLCTTGFVHRNLSAASIERADGVAPDYGNSFLTETFARDVWGSALAELGVDVIGCVPAALGLYQDVHVLRRRR